MANFLRNKDGGSIKYKKEKSKFNVTKTSHKNSYQFRFQKDKFSATVLLRYKEIVKEATSAIKNPTFIYSHNYECLLALAEQLCAIIE